MAGNFEHSEQSESTITSSSDGKLQRPNFQLQPEDFTMLKNMDASKTAGQDNSSSFVGKGDSTGQIEFTNIWGKEPRGDEKTSREKSQDNGHDKYNMPELNPGREKSVDNGHGDYNVHGGEKPTREKPENNGRGEYKNNGEDKPGSERLGARLDELGNGDSVIHTNGNTYLHMKNGEDLAYNKDGSWSLKDAQGNEIANNESANGKLPDGTTIKTYGSGEDAVTKINIPDGDRITIKNGGMEVVSKHEVAEIPRAPMAPGERFIPD